MVKSPAVTAYQTELGNASKIFSKGEEGAEKNQVELNKLFRIGTGHFSGGH